MRWPRSFPNRSVTACHSSTPSSARPRMDAHPRRRQRSLRGPSAIAARLPSKSCGARRTPRLRQLLIVAQVAASVLVLATAGVFVRGFQKALALNPGFDSTHLLTVDLEPQRPPLFAPAERRTSTERCATPSPPCRTSSQSRSPTCSRWAIAASPHPADRHGRHSRRRRGLLRTMGIPLLRGRAPDGDEASLAVVNQALADRQPTRRTAPSSSVELYPTRRSGRSPNRRAPSFIKSPRSSISHRRPRDPHRRTARELRREGHPNHPTPQP